MFFKKNKNSEFKNLLVQTEKKEKIKKEQVDVKWIIRIVIITFVISFSLSFVSQMTIPNLSIFWGILITLLFIFIGIIFDIIGVAVASADEKVFHSMNSRKVTGANVAVKFKKNADKVASFCNDVIGDICGIISGASATTIAVGIASALKCELLFVNLTVAAVVASLTIGGTLFDLDKLNNISKTYFSRKSGEEVFEETLKYAEKFDKDYYDLLISNKDYMIKFLNIEKDGPRPRKDIAKYSDVKEEFSYAIDSIFERENYAKYDGNKVYDVNLITEYVNLVNLDCTNEEWFNGVKEFAINHGYAASPKEYKQNPDSYKGHVGDLCEALRVMITGRTKSPDLFSIMKILGKDRIKERIELYTDFISK